MMKQLKDVFGRKTSIWLTLELVLVTFACWWALDPVLVTSYITHLPLGYNPDRIVLFETASTFNQQSRNDIHQDTISEEESLLQKIQEMDDIELAYRTNTITIGFGNVGVFLGLIHNGDSIVTHCFSFIPNEKMFEVFGIESLTPEVPTAELTRDCELDRTLILTRSLAKRLFGTIDVAGRTVKVYFNSWDDDKEDYAWMTKDLPIRAVVEDIRYDIYDRDCANLFMCQSIPSFNMPIIARLREGVNAKRFMEEHQQEVQHNLVTEHCYVRNMQTPREAHYLQTRRVVINRLPRRNLFIAAFFPINLSFGVFGTLLMYTRQRREEAGVRRAFGATKWSVFWGFIREAWLLTTISVVLGCIVYFQFAAAHGLFKGFEGSNPAVHYWFDDFGTHFLVVSVIVYLIILCAVLIATAIPALKIIGTRITEALRDE